MLVRSKGGDSAYDRAIKQESWPTISVKPVQTKAKSGHSLLPRVQVVVDFEASFWNFDGSFQNERVQEKLTAFCMAGESIPLTDLRLCPLRYTPKQTSINLLRRGRIFWACRKRKYITYNGWDYDSLEFFVRLPFIPGRLKAHMRLRKMCALWWIQKCTKRQTLLHPHQSKH
jgi:hypothetical protein